MFSAEGRGSGRVMEKGRGWVRDMKRVEYGVGQVEWKGEQIKLTNKIPGNAGHSANMIYIILYSASLLTNYHTVLHRCGQRR